MKKQKFPEPTAGALIFNPQGKILLVKSHKWHNRFVMPGGHIELGETIQQALKREIKEETGLHIYDIRLMRIEEFIFDNNYWKKKHYIFFDHICRTKKKKVVLNYEGQDYIWTLPRHALHLNVEPYTKKTIKFYLQHYAP